MAGAVTLVMLAATACTRPNIDAPPGSAAARSDTGMQRVLAALEKLGPQRIETLTPADARKQPNVSHAVQAVAQSSGLPTIPIDGVTTLDIAIPGPAGEIPARVYTPATGQAPFPVIVYYHGGGWVVADLKTYDSSARALAREASAIVVSSHYRQAPEHKFPAAHEDAFAAYKWVVQNGARINADPRRVAVAGESAGGNLAANVGIMARDQKVQAPLHQILVYPVAGTDMNTPSYLENAQAKPLNKPTMEWFAAQTLRPQDMQSPMINLVAADLRNLPPATVITAEIDPLRSEGRLLAERLREAGVEVTARDYEGVTHEFFGVDAVLAEAKAAQNLAGQQLVKAFAPRTQ